MQSNVVTLILLKKLIFTVGLIAIVIIIIINDL